MGGSLLSRAMIVIEDGIVSQHYSVANALQVNHATEVTLNVETFQ
ncbi:MAG: hypothetical protein M0Z37_10150 [Nitrospiraceae bacterium]|nr:hypothetical protein [Nitrospiraceae bacterium]